MKDKYKEITDTADTEDEQEGRKAVRRASIAVILIVLILVTIVSCIMYVVELYFGKTAGTVSLIIIAILIAGYLYRNEIKAKFKRK